MGEGAGNENGTSKDKRWLREQTKKNGKKKHEKPQRRQGRGRKVTVNRRGKKTGGGNHGSHAGDGTKKRSATQGGAGQVQQEKEFDQSEVGRGKPETGQEQNSSNQGATGRVRDINHQLKRDECEKEGGGGKDEKRGKSQPMRPRSAQKQARRREHGGVLRGRGIKRKQGERGGI